MLLRKALADGTRRALRAVGFRAVTRTIRGAPIRIPVDMGKLEPLLFDSSYCPFFNEDEVMDALVARIRPGDAVFDIGAHHGVWAILLARHVTEVVAFEPQPRTFDVLQEMIAVNGARNVSAACVALGSEPQTADFWGTGSGASLRPGALRPSHTRVTVDTLDRFVERRGSPPDVLKIDVEGAEYHVLLGGRQCLARARLVCIEVHFDELPKFGASYEMVLAVLMEAGFAQIMRSTPTRLGADDSSRAHVIFEKASELRQAN
jgi:FkbM family methyltransferase